MLSLILFSFYTVFKGYVTCKFLFLLLILQFIRPYMLTLKKELYQNCKTHLLQKSKQLQTAIAEIQDAINNETKSSAGDKYETAREMMEQDIEVNMVQLAEVQKQIEILERINPAITATSVVPGSLVKTTSGNYFIAISIGQLKLNEQTFYIISSQSPIGKLLMGQSKNASINFNGKAINILEIY